MQDPLYLDAPTPPTALDAPPARGRVLVVAPHSDDEVIGPGGTVMRHRQLGDPVRIVVLTDGTRGDAQSSLPQHEYRALREAETRAAAARMGTEPVEFCRFPDGTRAREEDLGVVVPRLLDELLDHPPAVIYCPHPGEVHGDHYVAAVATLRAVAESGLAVRCFGYEIWSALRPDVVVDVTAVMEEKRDLARLYASQTEHTDIVHFFGGLNAYRAVYLPKGARYGEAFQVLTPRRDFR